MEHAAVKADLPAQAQRLVPYLNPEEVRRLTAGYQGRHRERDAFLILVLFHTAAFGSPRFYP